MTQAYLIPAAPLDIEQEFKHSRFITRLFHCTNTDDFRSVYKHITQEFPGANHYCYAYVLGKPTCNMTLGFSDDGEPSGSAGRPMLAVLQGSGIGEIAAIVVRYFGGTKLGVGGLVRAYSSGIKQGLPQLVTITKVLRDAAEVQIDYGQLKQIEYLITKYDGVIIEYIYQADVIVKFELSQSHIKAFNQELANITQGQLTVKLQK